MPIVRDRKRQDGSSTCDEKNQVTAYKEPVVVARYKGHRTSHGDAEAYPPAHDEQTCQSTPKHAEHDLPPGPEKRGKC